MTMIKLQFVPGINRDVTDYSNEGGWWDCDKIRFRAGYPQKIGGWGKYIPTSFLGTCRQLWNWVTTYGDNLLAIPTHIKVYLEVAGYYNDITPLRTTVPTLSTTDTDNCINTTDGSTTVTVILATAHNASTGDYVTISGVTGDVGGIPDAEINANHEITTINSTAFTISSETAATSTVSGSGGTSINIDFELEVGYALNTYGYGWGAGTWSRGAWGLGSTYSPILIPQRDWWADNFDNDLVFNIRNGEGYIWQRGATTDPTTALQTRGIRLVDYADNEGFTAASVPVAIGQLLTSQTDKHLIAFGAVPLGSTSATDFDPLLIRWADQDTPADWTDGVLNTAGSLHISRGSRILRALPTRQEILVWTDASLHSLQFLGTTDVFGLQEYASNISLMSPRAVASVGDLVFWMGKNKFYSYTGRVDTLPCTVRDYVFSDLNYDQTDQIIGGSNENWNELWWFYPSADASWNNRYVVYNYIENIWYYGSLERTAWLDSPLRNYPIGVNSNSTTYTTGYIYNHEYGLDDDEAAMESFIESSDYDLGDGDYFMLTKRVLPDLTFTGSTADNPSANLQLRPRRFPGSATDPDDADTQAVTQVAVDQFTKQVFIRARARQMAFEISSSAAGVHWKLGSPRVDGRRDGRA